MLGSLNPLPMQVGGGPTPASLAYDTLRQAVGDGGSAPDDRGIEGLWRRSEAKGLAAASSHCRRALVQSSPLYATDLLPYYERILGLVPQGSEAERREVVVPRWTKAAENATPILLEQLQAIDSRLSLLSPSHDGAGTAGFGRAFAPLEPGLEGPAFGLARGHVEFPNYSTDTILRVLFVVGYDGPLQSPELLVVERVRELLRSALPSTTDFTIVVQDGLWHVGVTPIGFGGVA